MSLETTSQGVIEAVKQKIPIAQQRSAPAATDYFEAVLSHQDLQACYGLLSEQLGAPPKEFGKSAKFESKIQKAVDRLGGIRLEQCLFLKTVEPQRVIYAALWPWASDATRVTLKIGVLQT